MYCEGGITNAKAEFTSGNSQVVGTIRPTVVGVGEGVAAGSALPPQDVSKISATDGKMNLFIANNLPD